MSTLHHSKIQWQVCVVLFLCEIHKIYLQKQRIHHWQVRKGGNVHQRSKICSHKRKLHQHPAQHGDSSESEPMVPLTSADREGISALTLMYNGD